MDNPFFINKGPFKISEILNFLGIKINKLYEDIDVDVMIKEYKDTIDHINDNGISNVVHV